MPRSRRGVGIVTTSRRHTLAASADVSHHDAVPRIDAPTLAEHRARRRAAVLRAAEDIVGEHGVAGLTLAAVATRTGLARPSVYAYVASADALLVELVREGFERWARTLEDTTAGAESPEDVVRSWFRAAARSAHAGNHRLAAALTGVTLPDDVRESLLAGHRATAAPLTDAAARLGLDDGAAATAMVMAVVQHCIDRVEAGGDPDAEADRAAVFTLGGLRALAQDGRRGARVSAPRP